MQVRIMLIGFGARSDGEVDLGSRGVSSRLTFTFNSAGQCWREPRKVGSSATVASGGGINGINY